MAFVYEELNKQDLELYPNIDLNELKGWYIDKERDVSIWGGLSARHWMEMSEGNYNYEFRLRIGSQLFVFTVAPGEGSKNIHETPYLIVWDSIVSYEPLDLNGHRYDYIVSLLKEALMAWGTGYHNNTKWHPNFIVQFSF